MKDNISRSLIGTLHPIARERFIAFIDEIEEAFEVTVRIVQGYRSMAQQQAIYDQGRSKPGKIVTWSPPGSSYHNYGLAIDVAPWKADHSALDWGYDYKRWLPIAIKHELNWGGLFPKGKEDGDHYEFKAGYNWRDLLHKQQVNDLIPGTNFVKL